MMIHRIAGSENYPKVGLKEARHECGLGDIADMHRYLNYLEEVEAAHQKNQPDPDDVDT